MRVLSALLLAALCSTAFGEEDEIFESDSNDAYKAVVEVSIWFSFLLWFV